jgi:hypothetical protein
MEEVLRIIEVTGSDILKFNHNCIQSGKVFARKLYMIGERSKLSIPWREDDLKVSPLMEYIIHIPSLFGIPAVLGTKTADSAFQQSLIKLFLKRCRPE